MHRDGPIVTASVALNAPDEYGGGGTLIEAVGRAGRDAGAQGAADPGDAIRPGSGCVVLHPNLHPKLTLTLALTLTLTLTPTLIRCVVLHPGNVRHGGAPISSGVRYILVPLLTHPYP